MNFAHLKEELVHLGELASQKASAFVNSDAVSSMFNPMKTATSDPANKGNAQPGNAAVPEAEPRPSIVMPVPDSAPATKPIKTLQWHSDVQDDTIDQKKKKILQRSSTLVSSPAEALEALLAGNERFLKDACLHPHQSAAHLNQLCDSQKPFAAVLGCADSRVPPEILFDQGFGDLFVCRVAGNLASAEQVASLEYAVAHLHIKLIMIMGHAKCGACGAALADILHPDGHHELEGHLDVLVDHLAVAVERGKAHNHDSSELLDDIVKENVLYQVERLSKAPVIKHAIAAGQCKVVGGYYDLNTHGVVLLERQH